MPSSRALAFTLSDVFRAAFQRREPRHRHCHVLTSTVKRSARPLATDRKFEPIHKPPNHHSNPSSTSACKSQLTHPPWPRALTGRLKAYLQRQPPHPGAVRSTRTARTAHPRSGTRGGAPRHRPIPWHRSAQEPQSAPSLGSCAYQLASSPFTSHPLRRISTSRPAHHLCTAMSIAGA